MVRSAASSREYLSEAEHIDIDARLQLLPFTRRIEMYLLCVLASSHLCIFCEMDFDMLFILVWLVYW